MATGSHPVRRGLPRIPGGKKWPETPSGDSQNPEPLPSQAANKPVRTGLSQRSAVGAEPPSPSVVPKAEEKLVDSSADSEPDRQSLRRGLPRTVGGDAWPHAGLIPASARRSKDEKATAVVSGPPQAIFEAAKGPSIPPKVTAERRRSGQFTRGQWVGVAVVGGIAVVAVAAVLVLAARWFLDLDYMQDFTRMYPGEYELPETAPVGVPAWLAWQHFFNVFLIVLIIRSGLGVRRENRPTVFWSSRRRPGGKISLTLWLHQSLDLLWLINGAVFVVLLFVTGEWMRIVPTSWEVFPNALSAALQYASLDWPTENGWVNYNSLQQLAYFATVFIAAPAAAATGVRMSGVWPKGVQRLDRVYPVEWARKIHFPVMLYFVAFIVVHVVLVFATGALRNLNHMYAAQGSRIPEEYADNWTGFWLFAVSMLVVVAAVIAARPIIIAPIARLFGTVGR